VTKRDVLSIRNISCIKKENSDKHESAIFSDCYNSKSQHLICGPCSPFANRDISWSVSLTALYVREKCRCRTYDRAH